MKVFPHRPVTIVGPINGEVRLACSAEFNSVENEWLMVWDHQGMDATAYQVQSSLADGPDEVRFWTPSGREVVIRETIESDAESAGNHPFLPEYPLPVEIIGAIMNGLSGPTILYGASDLNGDVPTMILETSQGLYARFGRAWHKTSPNNVSEYSMVPVEDFDLETFDQADEKGQMLTRGSLSALTSQGRSAPPIITEAAPVVASSPITGPIIASLDDMPAAVEWANDNEGFRWFVEKRAKALKFEGQLPWEESE